MATLKQSNPEQERKEIYAYLGMHQPFFAHLLYQQLEFVWSDQFPTAATDGKRLWFNPKFWALLTGPERVFVIAHEIMHCVLCHPWRRMGRDGKKWNIAGDLLINDCLIKSKIGTMPKMGLLDNSITFDSLSTEKVYDMLPDMPTDGVGGGGGGGGGQKGKGKIRLDPDAQPLDDLVDPSAAGDDPDATDRDWHIATAAAKETAKINWKERLREWFQVVTEGRDRRTYMRPNRRYQDMDVIFSGWFGETVGDIVVACDTSGSVSEAEWAQFKGEIMSILEEVKPRRTIFIYCDAKIQKVDEVAEGSAGYEPSFVGRGGTSFKPPFKWVDENNITPEAFIYFTDGFGDFPEVPHYPVFWGITSTVVAPWGTTIPVVIDK